VILNADISSRKEILDCFILVLIQNLSKDFYLLNNYSFPDFTEHLLAICSLFQQVFYISILLPSLEVLWAPSTTCKCRGSIFLACCQIQAMLFQHISGSRTKCNSLRF